jgi:hypothetical protein
MAKASEKPRKAIYHRAVSIFGAGTQGVWYEHDAMDRYRAQGAVVVNIPRSYGDLAVQMAAAFHNFLISKHLERASPVPSSPEAAPHRRMTKFHSKGNPD